MSSTLNSPIKATPKDVFMYLMNGITLFLVLASVSSLAFTYIEGIFPDTGNYYSGLDLDSVRWNIATLIIVFPVYLYTSTFLAKECRVIPEKSNLKIRKWFMYLVLFLATLVAMIDLSSLLYFFLGGELTLGFALKVLVLLVIFSLAILFYQRELHKNWSLEQLKIWFIASSLIILALIVYGIWKTYAIQTAKAIPVAYCKRGEAVTAAEDQVIQPLISKYSTRMGCEVGNNCLLKSNDHGTTKFSIAWKQACGPVMGGVYQLGDEGRGFTFQCEQQANKVCCWPVGYPGDRMCR